MRRSTAERFWEKVRKSDDCWEWQGSTVGFGYGQIRHNGPQTSAHRVSWELAHGSVPAGMWVLHRCDNPRCVRPDHLFLGTRQDNTDDMVRKHRNNPWGRRKDELAGPLDEVMDRLWN